MRNEFRKMKGIKLSYERQGQIFFALRNMNKQTEKVRLQISEKLKKAAGGDESIERALWEWCVLGYGAQETAMRNHIDASVLYRARKRLYENW